MVCLLQAGVDELIQHREVAQQHHRDGRVVDAGREQLPDGGGPGHEVGDRQRDRQRVEHEAEGHPEDQQVEAEPPGRPHPPHRAQRPAGVHQASLQVSGLPTALLLVHHPDLDRRFLQGHRAQQVYPVAAGREPGPEVSVLGQVIRIPHRTAGPQRAVQQGAYPEVIGRPTERNRQPEPRQAGQEPGEVDLVAHPVQGGHPVGVVIPEHQLRLQAGQLRRPAAERAHCLEQLVRLRAVLGVVDGDELTALPDDHVHRDVQRVRLGLRAARRDDQHAHVVTGDGPARAGDERYADPAGGGQRLVVVLLNQQQDAQLPARVHQLVHPVHQVAEHVGFLVHGQQHRVRG